MPRRKAVPRTSVSQRLKDSAANFPHQFQSCVQETDQYARSINLMPSIRPFPLPDKVIDQIEFRISRNQSFIKSQFNLDPSIYRDDEFTTIKNEEEASSYFQHVTDSLKDGREGLLVMLLSPPENVDLRHQEIGRMAEGPWRVVCGVVVRIGANDVDTDDAKESKYERAITTSFCAPNIPVHIAGELMRVTLARAIAEGLCFEDVAMNDDNYRGVGVSRNTSGVSTPVRKRRKRRRDDDGESDEEDCGHRVLEGLDRDRRFITIETNDLLGCPAVMAELITSDEMKFSVHVDKKFIVSPHEKERHEDKGKGLCPCVRRYYQRRDKERKRKESCHLDADHKRSCDEGTSTSASSCLNGGNPSVKVRSESVNGTPVKENGVCVNQISDDGRGQEQQNYYQYYTLNASRTKGLVSKWVPRKASHEVTQYFIQSLSTKVKDDKSYGFVNGMDRRSGLCRSSLTSSAEQSEEWKSEGETSSQEVTSCEDESEELGSSEEEEEADSGGGQSSQRYNMRRHCKENRREMCPVIEFDRCSRSSIEEDEMRWNQ